MRFCLVPADGKPVEDSLLVSGAVPFSIRSVWAGGASPSVPTQKHGECWASNSNWCSSPGAGSYLEVV